MGDAIIGCEYPKHANNATTLANLRINLSAPLLENPQKQMQSFGSGDHALVRWIARRHWHALLAALDSDA